MSRRRLTHSARGETISAALGAKPVGGSPTPNLQQQTVYKGFVLRLVRAGKHIRGDHYEAVIERGGRRCLTIIGRPQDDAEVLQRVALDAVTAWNNGRQWTAQATDTGPRGRLERRL